METAQKLKIHALTKDVSSSEFFESLYLDKAVQTDDDASSQIQPKDDVDEENIGDSELGLAPMNNGKVKCLKCNKILSVMGSAKRHYKYLHGTNKNIKKFNCPKCSKTYPFLEYLKGHMRGAHRISAKDLKVNFKPQFKEETDASVELKSEE